MAGGEDRNDAFSHDRSDGVSHSQKKPDASNLRESQSFFFSSPVPPQTTIKKTHPTAVSPHALQQYTHTHTHTHTANLRESPPSPVLNTQTHTDTPPTALSPHPLQPYVFTHTTQTQHTHTHTHIPNLCDVAGARGASGGDSPLGRGCAVLPHAGSFSSKLCSGEFPNPFSSPPDADSN